VAAAAAAAVGLGEGDVDARARGLDWWDWVSSLGGQILDGLVECFEVERAPSVVLWRGGAEAGSGASSVGTQDAAVRDTSSSSSSSAAAAAATGTGGGGGGAAVDGPPCEVQVGVAPLLISAPLELCRCSGARGSDCG